MPTRFHEKHRFDSMMYPAALVWTGMHAPFLHLLQETLEHHGMQCTRQAALEGRSGTVYTVPLLAEDEGKAYIIDAHLDPEPLPGAAVQDMADVMHDAGADGGVMCHLGPSEAGDEDGIVLWGHDELVRLVGSAKLAAVTGRSAAAPRFTRHRSHGPVAETVEELLPPAFQDGLPFSDALSTEDAPATTHDAGTTGENGAHASDADAADEVPFGFDLDALTADAGPTADTATEAEAPPPTSAPDAHFTYPLLPVRVLPDEARMRVKDKVYHADAIEMVLQPVHLLDYECDLLAEGSLRYDTISGRVQVDGTDKTPTEVDPEALDPAGFTRLDAPPADARERTLRTSPDRAKEVATTFLLEAHTRLVDVEVEDEEDGYSYTEKKRVAPRPDHIRLNPLGTFHRVLWRVRGPNGHVDIDAITGQAVEEALQRPNPDAMILD